MESALQPDADPSLAESACIDSGFVDENAIRSNRYGISSSSHFVVHSTAENRCMKNKTSCGTSALDPVSSDQYDVADENHFSSRRIEARCPQKMCITCGQTCGWSRNDFIWCNSWRVAQRVGSHIPYISRRCAFKIISEAGTYTR